MARNVSFHVAPRYTPGSPAMVSEEIAVTVASQEKENYEVALSGAYGESIQTVAKEQGLNGIAERRVERGNGWDVEDLITGLHLRRETIKASKLQPGDIITSIEQGPEYGRWDEHLPVKALTIAITSRPSHVIVRWEPVVGLHFMFDPHDLLKIERHIIKEE